MSNEAGTLRWPRIHARTAAMVLATMFAYSMVQGVARYLSSGMREPFLLVMFATGVVGPWCLLPIQQAVALNAPSPRRHPLYFVAIHLLAYAFGAVLGKLMQSVLSAQLAAALQVALPPQDFWRDLLYDVQTSLPVYASLALLLRSYYVAQREAQRATEAQVMERDLAEAKLAHLGARIGRNQLAGRLQTLREAMARDTAAGDRCLQELAAFLRRALAEEGGAPSSAPRPTEAPAPHASAPALSVPQIGVRGALWLLLASVSIAFVGGLAMQIAYPEGAAGSYGLALVRAFGFWLVLPISYVAVRAQPDPRGRWLRWAAIHALAQPLFIFVLSSVEYGMGLLYLELTKLPVPAPKFGEALLFEVQYASNAYVASAGLWTALYFGTAQRWADKRHADLARDLSATRLASLTARLEPHFLYNALNTVSALLYSDLPRALHLLEGMGEMLDAVFEDRRATWSLREERRHLQRYVDLVRARFGDRMRVELALPAALDDLLVPRFALQGLVENAVKHNQYVREAVHVRVVGEQHGSEATFVVSDDGCGFAEGGSARAGGLMRLEQVLRLLHGPAARLERSAQEDGGAVVRFVLPRSPSADAA